MEDPYEVTRWFLGQLLYLGLAIATAVLADPDTPFSYIGFTAIEAVKIFWAFWFTLLCYGRAKTILMALSEIGGNLVGCGLYIYMGNEKQFGAGCIYGVYIVLTLFLVLIALWDIRSSCKYADPDASGGGSMCSKGCSAFLGGANGWLGVGYGFFIFLADACSNSAFANPGPAVLINAHVWFTCAYNSAKLDGIIPTGMLAPREKWWFQETSEAQAFDVGAYKKWDMANVLEMLT
eukprot:g5923.t1